MNQLMSKTLILITLISLSTPVFSQFFIHPGILSTQTDIGRMIQKVQANAEPWLSGYSKLVSNSYSSTDYTSHPQQYVCAGGTCTNGENYIFLAKDCAAAYQNALRYRISGNTANADKAAAILNGWASTFEGFTGDSNIGLRCGLYGYQLVAAAELLRGYQGWSASSINQFKTMLLTKFYPINHDFLTNHNGTCNSHYWASWDLANMTTMLSIGVFCDDTAKFTEAINYFKTGVGSGQIDNLVNNLYDGHPTLGQGQESGRDQGHATIGVALIGIFCQVAYNQGIDLFSYQNNKILAFCEYTAKYNLGYDVPFTVYTNCENNIMATVSSQGRGIQRPEWELIFNHYSRLKGFYAPYSQEFAATMRPEGGGGDYGENTGGFDQIGFGTLTFTVDNVGDTEISEGVYRIVSRKTGKAISVENNSLSANSYVVQDSLNDCNCQMWQIVKSVDRQYHLKSLSTGMYLDIDGGNNNNVNTIVKPATGAMNQTFTFQHSDEGFYRITPVFSGKSLVVKDGNTSAGTHIVQQEYNNSSYAQWDIIPVKETTLYDGIYRIISRKSGMDISIGLNDTISGALLSQQSINIDQGAYWKLKKLSGDKYQIINLLTGKNMEVSNYSYEDGAKLRIFPYSGATNQQFRIRPVVGDSEYYYITAAHSDKGLNVAGGSIQAGAEIIQWPYKGETNEQWVFELINNDLLTNKSSFKLSPSIASQTLKGIKIYPNPSDSIFNFELENYSEYYVLSITSVSGQKMIELRGKGSTGNVNISNFPSGLYYVMIKTNEDTFKAKIVKK